MSAGLSPLARILRDRIAADGPMGLDLYMELCLGHPVHGYYRTRDPIGAAGDFVTAPEVSQIFGELIGLWLAQVWMDQGRPAPARLIELGPGRGTLMADALRAIGRAAPALLDASELVLVETSPALRARQAQALEAYAPRWADRVDEALAGGAAPFIVANEFFDALPIRQFHRRDAAWLERRVGVAGERFAYVDGPGAPSDALAARLGGAVGGAVLEGAVLEDCPAGRAIAAEIGRALATQGAGTALIIDYGYDEAALREAGGADTFQAARRHAYADPLVSPGEADLTAHVDFQALLDAAEGAAGFGPVGQGAFLRALGAEARTAQLARANPERAESLAAGLHRLTQPGEMGRLFKMIALTPLDAPPPPGLSPALGRARGG